MEFSGIHHRLPGFLSINHSSRGNKKVLAPIREQGQAYKNPAVPPCLPDLSDRSSGANTPSAHNAGDPSEDTLEDPFPSALCGPFAVPLFAPIPAPGALCGCADSFTSASTVSCSIDFLHWSTASSFCQELFSAAGGFISTCHPGRRMVDYG